MKDLSKEILAYALKNAIEFGKADAGRILPKLFQHGLDKKEIKEVMPIIEAIAKGVNALSKESREKEFELVKGLVKEREEKEKDLPELPNLEGGVVTRMPPEPSKYAHIGHAISFLLNYLSAKRYGGKSFLRFDDANPEKVSQEYVDAMLEDIEGYLGIKPDGIKYVSDDMELMYKYAEKLIAFEKVYVCSCERKQMQDSRHSGKECLCRKADSKKTLEEWGKMLKGTYKGGQVVLRIKGDMSAQNQVMRDPVLFRIVEAKHFRKGTKYKVWPMYDFYSPIEDDLMGITHILRSNEFDQRIELQALLSKLLGLREQTIIQYGRIGVLDGTTKGREIRELVASGEYVGWDDPRLVTLKALKRRGIKKEVIYELVKQTGLAQKESFIDFAMIASLSRKLIDAQTPRFFFVEDPVRVEVKDAPNIEHVHLPVHPDRDEKRTIKLGENLFISNEDVSKLKGKEVRFLHLYNIKLSSKISKRQGLKILERTQEPSEKFLTKEISGDFTTLENKNIPKIHWISEGIAVRVFMPDATWKEGIGEEGLMNLNIGDVVQFERFGFVKLDTKKEDVLEFWFTHD